MRTLADAAGKVVETAPPTLPGGRGLNPGMELAGGAFARTFTVVAPSVPIYFSSAGNNKPDNAKSSESSKAETVESISSLLKTEPNTAFFWSGRTKGVGGDEVAAGIAKMREGTTLETLIGKNEIKMPEYNIKNPDSIKHGKMFRLNMPDELQERFGQ